MSLRAFGASVVVGFGLGAVIACATLRPKLEVAREDFVQACRDFTSALLADAHPSQAELIAARVCAAEQMADRIEHEVVQDGKDLLAPFPDAGAQ